MKYLKIILSVVYGLVSIPMFYMFWQGGGILGLILSFPSIFAILMANIAFGWIHDTNSFNIALMGLVVVFGSLYGYVLISLIMFIYKKISNFR